MVVRTGRSRSSQSPQRPGLQGKRESQRYREGRTDSHALEQRGQGEEESREREQARQQSSEHGNRRFGPMQTVGERGEDGAVERERGQQARQLCLRLQRESSVRRWGVDGKGRGARGGGARVEEG